MEILDRIKLRLQSEQVDDDILNEYIQTITDRLTIRLKTDELPSVFNSVVVDATVKMHRRMYYEGISSENNGSLSTSFVDDILSEYQTEIDNYILKQNSEIDGNKKVVKFL